MTSESSARAHIRRESLDIYNRLHSIRADIAFVNQVRALFPLIRTASLLPSNTFPLTANLRCGAWSTDPAIVHSRSAYNSLRALSDDVICRRIPRHMRTLRARMVITETGLSTFAVQTCIYYPPLPLMTGTSPSSQPHLFSRKAEMLFQTYSRKFDACR